MKSLVMPPAKKWTVAVKQCTDQGKMWSFCLNTIVLIVTFQLLCCGQIAVFITPTVGADSLKSGFQFFYSGKIIFGNFSVFFKYLFSALSFI